MPDYPEQGSDSNVWGTGLRTFHQDRYHLSGTYGGMLMIVVNDNQPVCNDNQPVFNIDWSVQ